MIKGFGCGDTEALFEAQPVRRFAQFERAARRMREILNAASSLQDLRVPPGNRLEALKGDRKGQYGIRINGQWRICFKWNDGAENVEIINYH